jgi:HlyD family secretion protein
VTRKLAILLFASVWISGCEWPSNSASDETSITLSGTVEAREIDLAFQVPGRIAELRADEGSLVRAGELVAVLDAHDYELDLQRARAEAAAAQASLAALKAGTRKQELKAAQATLAKAKAEARHAAANFERVRQLYENNNVAREDLDQARAQHDVARATVEDARQKLELLKEGSRREDIERAVAEHQARTAGVKIAVRRLGYTQLHAPADGVISVRLAERGEVVAAGQPVFRLAELSRPWVRAYLSETDLARVRLGQPVAVRVDGLPDRVFAGRLSFISPVAEFTPKTVETRALRVDLVYRIKVEVDNSEGHLKIGMPADLTLETAPAS